MLENLAELSKQMPNGYFLEGFVRFVDPADDGDVVSLAFMGFRGEFQNLLLSKNQFTILSEKGKWILHGSRQRKSCR